MVQVTNFLLRWLFLCRLVDDRAEVQTWPYRRPGYYDHPPSSSAQQHHEPPPPPQHHPPNSPQQQQHHSQQPPSHTTTTTPQKRSSNIIINDDNDNMDIPTYRESVIRSLTSYPPGSSERLHRLEELRLEVVREFAQRLVHADEVIRWGALLGGNHEQQQQQQQHANNNVDLKENENVHDEIMKEGSGGNDNDGMFDSRLDVVDASIQDDFQQFMQQEHSILSQEGGKQHHHHSNLWKRWHFLRGHHEHDDNAAITDDESSLSSSSSSKQHHHNPLQHQTPTQITTSLTTAHKLLTETREFLPQLVSTVLHSPPALLPETLLPDPISSLRSLLIHRCQTTPSLGIELCWLLEAEVGRKWKALFEHRQQTGKRLILIVQADIAAAIATIVHRQSHLQLRLSELNGRLCRRMVTKGRVSIDVEDDSPLDYDGRQQQYYGHHPASIMQWSEENINEDMIRHSVHFPMEPQCVCWPGGSSTSSSSSSSSSNVASSSPSTTAKEQDGNSILSDFEHPEKHNGVVRALRILPQNCRVLDSAQRCPFLVRMEVVETGLDANDARLYAMDTTDDSGSGSGGSSIGLTIEEALGSVRGPLYGNSILGNDGGVGGIGGSFGGGGVGFDPCGIPPELMVEPQRHRRDYRPTGNDSTLPENDGTIHGQHQQRQHAFGPGGGVGASRTPEVPTPPYNNFGESTTTEKNKAVLSRGGYQGGGDEGYYASPDPADMIREQYYEELHHDLRQQRENDYISPDPSMTMTSSNQLAMGSALLDNVFGRPWNVECETIRQQSPYRNVKGWKLASFIIKAGEDIRKEALVMQIMSKLWTWFQEEIPPHLRPFLRPYTIMCVGGDAGIVECLPDVKSVNEVKKETDGFTTLRNFFERAYGPPVQPPFRPDYNQQQQPSITNSYGTVSFEKARDNFLRSLVGYSVICYILQIKDRHNANILMDREGHIMHIDFGFVLGETPKMGKVPLFSERAPFKLSAEFWEVIGGWSAFKRFCEMFEAAYAVAASHSDEICSLVEAAIMNVSRNTDLARSIADSVRGRIQMKADPKEQKMHIMNIVNDAITSWGTSTYDWLQRSMHGYQ
ncbi:hypothetical protein ACHAXR_008573 [Thalassiosira sp. AJA248-18]